MISITHQDIYDRWTNELKIVVPPMLEWWRDLHAQEVNREVVDARWPAGPASHPRVIALFRKYYFETTRLNDSLSGGGPEHGSEMWGSEAKQLSEESEGDGPVPPVTLLLSWLDDTEPELADFMRTFDFIPIGEDPEFEES
ncbi:hypothetical protein AB0V79_20955 [Mesorhizobium ciceri]|uniref:hypothetical protein n=1 Tax=Mesorhizobium TaxID=68287 RepID=UPI0007A94AFB|nr:MULTISPECIES: hypothetical protein [Mesorhizobium]AMY04076.1 hypothetical protein A4R29_30795 [Mesorhizobium ciceri biovar biserrulae]RUX71552.1 hypothetical protein EN990_28170 [Mesorhizobium sp. M7A.F.Ca.US.005.03.1.1]RUY09042.1 hypothetical protein EN991_30115 [Mesorhizobium sp. M7A.F.Ca.US.005.03.2.1]RVA86289.1 hypothetical protein EN925_24865 [Mesorhizobium sp. M7A.F.Ca.US.006.04.2.1]